MTMTRTLQTHINNRDEIIIERSQACCDNPKCDTVNSGRHMTIASLSFSEIVDVCESLIKDYERWKQDKLRSENTEVQEALDKWGVKWHL